MIELKKPHEDCALFTVCNIAYLHKALILADSIMDSSGRILNIYLFDRKQDLRLKQNNCVIHWITDLNIPSFSHLAFRYDIIELSTALKPFLTLHLLKEFEKVIFFDSDIFVFSDMRSIVQDLNENSILLTPHYTTPQSDHATESDTGMMRFGSFNLGFFGIRRSADSLDFLNWWSRRCLDLCYMESQFGLSTDQKWVSIAPCLFPDIGISFNLGYNVAPWNSWERKISKNAQGMYVVNDHYMLSFFHFSNFDEGDPGYLNKRSYYEKGLVRTDYLELGEMYRAKHIEKLEEIQELSTIKYSFNFMSNGDYISPLLRLAYSSFYRELSHVENPFDSADKVASFAQKNGLLSRRLKKLGYKNNVLNNSEKYSMELRIANYFLKLLLFCVGANKFYLFTKSLVFLSSPRLNKKLWRI